MTELRRFRPRLARRPSAPAAPFCFERASLELFARRRRPTGAQSRPRCLDEAGAAARGADALIARKEAAQLHPVRVEASVRKEIESVLHEGESLSEFVTTAAVQAARRRKAQEEFLARGRASLAQARCTGEFYAADEVLEGMRGRLEARMKAQRKATAAKSG